MKTLRTLIRFKKQQLDELRRRMGALENQRQQFINRSEGLRKEMLKELELAKGQPEMAAFFGNFAERIRLKQEEITLELMKLEEKMAKLTEQIREGFSEQKKLEVVQDRRLVVEREQQRRHENAQLDEQGEQRHRRMRKEDQPTGL